jgi:mRNA-degrading endonuclease toxin of MazEF toxin-antitoxin module
MRQWDIYDFPFAHPIGVHPALILSPDDVAANADIVWINVLIVTTVRPGYQPGRFDVMLNGADGLDHLSRVRVLPIFQVDRSDFGRRRGSLSVTRQKAIALKIRQVFRLG